MARLKLFHAGKLDVFIVEGFDGQVDAKVFGHVVVIT
jgi:hypothetical protein